MRVVVTAMRGGVVARAIARVVLPAARGEAMATVGVAVVRAKVAVYRSHTRQIRRM